VKGKWIVGLIMVFAYVSNAQRVPLSPGVLKNFIETGITGFTAGEPTGSLLKLDGLTYSSAVIEYKNPSGNYVRITLLDCTDAINMYNTAIALWETGTLLKYSESEVNLFDFGPGVRGWEEYRRDERIAVVALDIVDRFIMTIEADNQSGTDRVRNIAQNLELEQLVSQ
jgi:hypothetical protein